MVLISQHPASLEAFQAVGFRHLQCHESPDAAASSSVEQEFVTYAASMTDSAGSVGLDFWRQKAPAFPLLSPLAADIIYAPALQVYVVGVFSVCGDLTAGKHNQLTKTLEMHVFGKINMKYYS